MKSKLVVAFALVPFLVTVASAQEDATVGDPEKGKALAEISCARCHAIEAEGDSPLAEAPPFRDVMKLYKAVMLEEALAEGIVTGHADMPEFVFSAQEVSDLTAYLSRFED